ncbi:Uncharacterised protein [Mycobacteroides abscessus subsp. abscessus]|nr:Uncharacterised protein [Mycobacteroides abscessus subsp. abscessus]
MPAARIAVTVASKWRSITVTRTRCVGIRRPSFLISQARVGCGI